MKIRRLKSKRFSNDLLNVKRSTCIMILSLLLSATAMAQGIMVTGNVCDNNGETLIGVTVRDPLTKTGTITDVDGNFSIQISDPNTTLIFSYMGYEEIQYPLNGQTDIKIIMKENSKMLDEIVVVGYGVQKRRDVTGAVMSVKPDDLKNMPNTNIVQSLQAKIPGLNITNTGTSAEGETKMRVRAQNSINADAGPLIVLDGIQYEGMLSEISPSDIESIEVLKDASSAAIYGARAAGGVLLITTKKGTAGKTRINFNSTFGVENIINRPDMMDAVQFYNFKKERMGVSSFETDQYIKGVNTDWFDLATQTGFSQEYNLTISGGSDKTKYFVSGNVSQVKGVAKNDEFNRYTLRLNLDTEITSWLKYGTNTVLGYHDRPGEKAAIGSALTMNPLTEAYDVDGKLLLQPNIDDMSVTNPLEGLNIQKEDVARNINTINYLQVSFPFLKGLSFKTLAGYNFRTRLIESYQSSTATLSGQSKDGVASVNNQYKEDWSIENILNYNTNFGLHNLDLTGVYTSRKYVTKYHDNNGVGFIGDHMTYYQFKLATTLTPSDTYSQETALSQLFRINYNYDSKYLLTFSVRRDGFSSFGENNKYGVFPSLALGWNMERETFMKSFDWLDRSKLRFSYGESGNQAINAYETMPTMSNLYYLDNDGSTLVGFYPNKLADPTLSWETTRQFNIGWDYSFLKGRIFGSFDVFSANTFDLLLYKKIPQINGVNSIRQNIGETKSRGYEFSISTANIKTKDFTWSTDFNVSYSKNEIVNVGLFDENGKALDNLANNWFIGKSLDVIYAYEFDGIWQETDDILSSHMPTSRPGDVRIVDYNKDGKITEDDKHIIGHSSPYYRFGLMNTFNYKNFALSFFLNAAQGGKRGNMNSFFDGKTNLRQREWWTPENKINTFPANRDGSNPYAVNIYGKTNDISYIRLSDISLGYNFPQEAIDKIGVSKLELFANVKNVFTLTNFTGLDPEYSSNLGIPPTRTFSFGFRLGL